MMRTLRRRLLVLAVVLAGMLPVAGCQNAEKAPDGPGWPRWRGPAGDGVSTETSWNPLALQGAAKIRWKQNVGAGYSSASISGSRLYVMGMKNRKSWVFCLDASSGRMIWSVGGTEVFWPQATPTVEGGRLYCLYQEGTLLCLNALDGSTVWKTRLSEDLHAGRPTQGWAASPVVSGRLLLVNANSKQVALDKMTGALVWQREEKVPSLSWGSYATPSAVDLGGSGYALFFGPTTLSAVNLSTGATAWSYEHGDEMHTVADPVVQGDQVFVSSTVSGVLLKMTATGVKEVWKSPRHTTWLPGPVLVGGYLYGSFIPAELFMTTWSEVQRKPLPFRCVEWTTGRVMWEREMDYVSLMAAGDKLIMIQLDGAIRIAQAVPDAYRELASTRVLADAKGPKTFAVQPVLSNGKLYCRNFSGELTCIDAR